MCFETANAGSWAFLNAATNEETLLRKHCFLLFPFVRALNIFCGKHVSELRNILIPQQMFPLGSF